MSFNWSNGNFVFFVILIWKFENLNKIWIKICKNTINVSIDIYLYHLIYISTVYLLYIYAKFNYDFYYENQISRFFIKFFANPQNFFFLFVTFKNCKVGKKYLLFNLKKSTEWILVNDIEWIFFKFHGSKYKQQANKYSRYCISK